MSELDVIVEIKAVMYKALDDDDNINKVVKSKIYMENKLTLKFYQKTPKRQKSHPNIGAPLCG